MPTHYTSKDKKKTNKTTAKDVPGSGMARLAGDAIAKRQAAQKKIMDDLFGGNKKKK